MNHSLGVAIETLVAILLVLTVGYCALLNRRLKRLKADEHSLKATIGELITATEIAERAIGGLKHAVRDVNENLGNQLASATQLSEHLKRQLAEGDHVMRRLTKIAIAARPPQVEAEIKEPVPREPAARDFASRDAAAKPSDTRALAAAAQAFSERRRSGGLAA
jgi:chromosome segregation ATPase